MSEEPTSSPVNRITLAAAGVLSFALLAALVIVPYLPTHDGPQHIFLGYLDGHLQDPAKGWAQAYQPAPQLTSMGFSALFGTLASVLPWRTALTASLCIISLVWAWSYFGLAHALHPKRAAIGLLGFGCVLQWTLYMGFFSFVMSTGLSFLTLALAVRRSEWNTVRRLAIGALLTVQAVLHLFPAQLVGGALLFVVLFRKSDSKLRELGLLALMGLPAMLITAAVVGDSGEYLAASRYFDMADRVRLLGATFVSGPGWRAWPPVLAALLGIGLTLRNAWTSRSAMRRDDVALATYALLLFVLALVSPIHLSGWEFFSPRLLPLATMLGIATLPLEKLSISRQQIATAVVGAFALGSIGWAGSYNKELDGRMKDALSGLDKPLVRSGPRLAVILEPYQGRPEASMEANWRDARVPFFSPLWNIAKIYAVEQGGLVPWSFGSRGNIHPYVLTDEARAAFPVVPDPVETSNPAIVNNPEARRELVNWLAELGVRFDDVILFGRPEDGDVLVERGYVIDHRQGALTMAHFEGCPVSIEVPFNGPLPHRLIIEYAWSKTRPVATQFAIPAGTVPDNGSFSVTPRGSLCGPMWLRVSLDRDGSDSATEGDAHCEGAKDMGFAPIVPTAEQSAIICRLAL